MKKKPPIAPIQAGQSCGWGMPRRRANLARHRRLYALEPRQLALCCVTLGLARCIAHIVTGVLQVLIELSSIDIGKIVAPIARGEHTHVQNLKTKRW